MLSAHIEKSTLYLSKYFMILWFLLLFRSLIWCQNLESTDSFDKATGVYRDAHPEMIFVTNGETPAMISIALEPELLNITLPQVIQSHTSHQVCKARDDILKLVDQANDDLGAYAKEKIEQLEMDSRILDRTDRAIFASVGLAITSGVASGLAGGVIDQLFSQRREGGL